MAKARASDAATAVTHDAIQTLGGIGFTWEHDVHFLLKRARVCAQLLGRPAQHRARVASARRARRAAPGFPALAAESAARASSGIEAVVRRSAPQVAA